jgi:hypothetical protein
MVRKVLEEGEYFATHESVAVAWVDETREMDSKHSHIESDRDDNKTQHTGKEMLDIHLLLVRNPKQMDVPA